MPFKFPEKYEEERQQRELLKYVTYGEEEIHVSEFGDRSITVDMMDDMYMNSYARDDIFPKLTTDNLIDTAKRYQSNCSGHRSPCATYDEAMIHKIVPELIKRLEENTNGKT